MLLDDFEGSFTLFKTEFRPPIFPPEKALACLIVPVLIPETTLVGMTAALEYSSNDPPSISGISMPVLALTARFDIPIRFP